MREAEQRMARNEEEDKERMMDQAPTAPLPPSPGTQHFHEKTASMTGSVDSEAPSDSTLSFPSSSARKPLDGSEADSERDSVSPQRGHEEVGIVTAPFSTL